eukprot:9992595-Lingulodinium_polyedra.AAC.1
MSERAATQRRLALALTWAKSEVGTAGANSKMRLSSCCRRPDPGGLRESSDSQPATVAHHLQA